MATTSTLPTRPRHAVQESTSLWWWIKSILSWMVVIAVLALLATMIVIPRVAGAVPYTVLTGSMKPHYPPGTLIIVKPTDPQSLTIGQVITYQVESGKPGVVTHRIISVGYSIGGERTFVTQGDANEAPDENPVRAVQVRGVLWYSVPYVGYLNTWLTGRVRGIVVGLIVAGLLSYAVIMFIGAGRDRRRTVRERSTVPSKEGS